MDQASVFRIIRLMNGSSGLQLSVVKPEAE